MPLDDLPWWHDLDFLEAEAPDYLRELAERNDALFAMLREREAEQRIDAQACEEWLMSPAARDYLPEGDE
jgi:hypothetical protein